MTPAVLTAVRQRLGELWWPHQGELDSSGDRARSVVLTVVVTSAIFVLLLSPDSTGLLLGLLALTAWILAMWLLARQGFRLVSATAIALILVAFGWWPPLLDDDGLALLVLVAPVGGVAFAALTLPPPVALVCGLIGGISLVTVARSASHILVLEPSGLLFALVGIVTVGLGIQVTRRRDLGVLSQALESSLTQVGRFELAQAGADAGLWHWDLVAQSVQLSGRAEVCMALSSGEDHSEATWLANVHPADIGRLRQELTDFAAGRVPALEARFRVVGGADEDERAMVLRGAAVRGPAGKAIAIGGSITDVTVWKQYEEELARGAFHDFLTGLPNRALFIDRVAHACARSLRQPERIFCVLFLDIDGFKNVNDSLGHPTGDSLLVQLGKRLEGCLRPQDTLARLGGDEFTVLLEDLAGVEGAERVAKRIIETLKTPFRIDGHELVVSASIGITNSQGGYEDAEHLLRDADTAMYYAKAAGKAQYRLFVPDMREHVLARMHLEHDLYRAIEREEFELYFQPILSLQTRQILGFEALVRWRRPDGKLVGPGEFIPLSEETGQIMPISDWVLEQACRTVFAWRRDIDGAEALWVNVNVSGRQLARPGLADQMIGLLARFKLPPSSIRLEITESVMLAEGVEPCLQALCDAGIELHLDDFGTGYSSLSYLHNLPLAGLKIDRAFVMDLHPEAELGIVHSILQLAENLKMSVTAEGVETEDQLQSLISLGCEKAQGYLFARPMPAADAAEMLVEQARKSQAEAEVG